MQLVREARKRVEETDGVLNAVPEDLRGWQQAEQQAQQLMDQGWPMKQDPTSPKPPWFLYGEGWRGGSTIDRIISHGPMLQAHFWPTPVYLKHVQLSFVCRDWYTTHNTPSLFFCLPPLSHSI